MWITTASFIWLDINIYCYFSIWLSLLSLIFFFASKHFFLPRYMPSLCALPGWWPAHTPPLGTMSHAAASTTSALSTAWRLGRETSGSAGNYLAIQVRTLSQTGEMLQRIVPRSSALGGKRCYQTLMASFTWLIDSVWDTDKMIKHGLLLSANKHKYIFSTSYKWQCATER